MRIYANYVELKHVGILIHSFDCINAFESSKFPIARKIHVFLLFFGFFFFVSKIVKLNWIEKWDSGIFGIYSMRFAYTVHIDCRCRFEKVPGS